MTEKFQNKVITLTLGHPVVPGECGVSIAARRSFVESPGVAPRGRLVLPAPTAAGGDTVGIVADAVGETHGGRGERAGG